MNFEVNIQWLVIPGKSGSGGWWAWWPKKPEAMLFKGKEYVCLISGGYFQESPDDLLIKWFTEKKPDIAAKRPTYNIDRSVGTTEQLR